MTTKQKVQNFRSSKFSNILEWRAQISFLFPGSPLVTGGTSKTQRRRSRSRSRQRIESELVKKVDEIPAVHDTVEYLLSAYCLIKVAPPIHKVKQLSKNKTYFMKIKVIC